MSPRKKKDPAAQLAADAAVAFAIESVADDPRGAPETLHGTQRLPAASPVAVEQPSRYVSMEPNAERGTSDGTGMTGNVQDVVANATAHPNDTAERVTQDTPAETVQNTANSLPPRGNAPMPVATPTSTKSAGNSSQSPARSVDASGVKNIITTTLSPSTLDGSVDHATSPNTASPEKPCALDGAPDGAKCIVARTDEGKVVRILTPAGTQVLDKSDVFYTLPTGVKVKKVQGGVYRVYRLGISNEPMFDAPSAREAVTRYLMTA